MLALASARRTLALTGAMALAAAALALPQAPAAPAVPTPESVLGFVPGEDRKLADWGQVLAYLRALDAASDRVSVEELGKTTQGRPFVMVTVTSAANHARLEEIRRMNARIADPRGLGDDEAERLMRQGKVIVAMAYSIHSTEVGGTLAALRFLHRLAATDDARLRAMLDDVVLLVIPSHNPDGTEIVSQWYRQELGTPFEGTAPPVLYHPYVGHDNNRDWYTFTQVETRLTVEHLYQRWHPQIVHDVHQMGARGARLFVPPYTDPWEPNVDPALTAAVNALGSHVASRLITEGRSGIVTGALFDAWTPARAYAVSHGGVRILSETASARIASPLEVKPEELEGRTSEYDARRASANFPLPWPGGTWRLSDIVETQLSASLAVLEHAAQNREHWLRTALAVNRRASARREPFAFVMPAEPRDASALARLVDVLRTGEVELLRAKAPFTADGRRYAAGAIVVRLQQPASGFAKMLLERQVYPDLREYKGGPPKPPYDVTAHTLPLLFGVDVEAVAAPFEAELVPLGDTRVTAGRVEGRGPRLALGHTSGDLVALSRLLAAGVQASWTLEPFEEDGRRFPPGTLLVPGSARRKLEKIAAELGVVARSVRAAPRSLALRTPRVGLYRSWVPSMDEGWTRFVFEKEMAVAYQTLVDKDVRAGRLAERFDAIVLPAQSAAALRDGHAKGAMPDEYTGGLGETGAAALRAFVEAGGTLVALDSATAYAIEALKLPVKNALAGVDSKSFFCPGSILRVSVDTRQPIAHGLPEVLPVWFEGSPAFETAGGTALARYGDEDPLLSGFLLGGERLRGRAALVEAPLGRGKVVLFGFRPQYRAQSRVTYAALLNALYLSAARP
jgi:Zinc carboxypeptidase